MTAKHAPTMREALSELLKAAEEMPHETPAPGGAFTMHSFMIEAAIVWQLDRAIKHARAALSQAEPEPVVSIQTMRLSNGCDYYVSIKVGDREVTPHRFREAYKAAYHVALYGWLLNGGDQPDLMAFGLEDFPAQPATSTPLPDREAIARIISPPPTGSRDQLAALAKADAVLKLMEGR